MLTQLAALWDRQKLALASNAKQVRYVRNAEGDEWWSARRYWASDGIHPNDEGYRIWGEHIAASILMALKAVP